MNAKGHDTDAQTIEPLLENLIVQHGIAKVNAHLAELLTGRPWADWQRVQNTANNIARRLDKQQSPQEKKPNDPA